jgi:hypothetical protein
MHILYAQTAFSPRFPVNSHLRQHYHPRPDRVPRLLRWLWSWL